MQKVKSASSGTWRGQCTDWLMVRAVIGFAAAFRRVISVAIGDRRRYDDDRFLLAEDLERLRRGDGD